MLLRVERNMWLGVTNTNLDLQLFSNSCQLLSGSDLHLVSRDLAADIHGHIMLMRTRNI